MSNIADGAAGKQEKTTRSNGQEPKSAKVVDIDEAKWREYLSRDADGHPLGCLSNAIRIFQSHPEWKGILGFDQNSGTVMARRCPPSFDPQRLLPFAWTDEDTIAASNWLQNGSVGPDHDKERLGDIRIYTSKENVADAITHVAHHYPFHPIKDYLNSLEWDGVERLSYWLQVYFGAELHTKEQYLYAEAISRCFLIGAVARVFLPGCQMDTCLILEGMQGDFKSSGLKKLFHGPLGERGDLSPWFTDQMPDISTKEASIQLKGKWLAEFSDMGDPFKEAKRETLKAFISRSTDRYRPVRAKQAVDIPRQCVFAGTTNKQFWNGDETGARRFWPIKVRYIDLRGIVEDRDQLLAEAMVHFRAREQWHLTPAEEKLARAEQEDRRELDPWESDIAGYLFKQLTRDPPPKPALDIRDETSVRDILQFCLLRDIGLWNRWDETRVSHCLVALGWRKFRESKGAKQWKYRALEVTAKTARDEAERLERIKNTGRAE